MPVVVELQVSAGASVEWVPVAIQPSNVVGTLVVE